MWKKCLIISLCISVLFVFSAPISSVNAKDREIQIDWKIVGTTVGLMPLYSATGEFAGFNSLLNLSAQGPPGPAKITVLSRFDGATDPSSCPSGYQNIGYAVVFDKNDGVVVFPNGSFLFVSINAAGGILCFSDDGSGTYFRVKMDIKGGTGFYDGASGVIETEGYDHSASPDATISALTGTVTGEIEFSD